MGKGVYILRRLDAHGQPIRRQWNASRLADRTIDELVGICKALISDQRLSEEEIGFLQSWLQTHQQTIDVWPANIIAGRVSEILADQIIDAEERSDLFNLLAEIVGQANSGPTPADHSTALPLTKPAPPIFFAQQRFCVTGRFASGRRANVEFEIVSRGGITQANVTDETNYLVIGTIGSSDWLHSTHGRKIEKALHMVERGHPIAIVSEEHWMDHLL